MRGRKEGKTTGVYSQSSFLLSGHIRRMPRQSQAAKQRSDMSAWLIAWEGHAWTERRKDDGRGSPPKRKNLPDRGAEKASAGRDSPPSRTLFIFRGVAGSMFRADSPPKRKNLSDRGAEKAIAGKFAPTSRRLFIFRGPQVKIVFVTSMW